MGLLGNVFGGIGKGIGDTFKGVTNMIGSGVAGIRDLGSLISTGKLGDETEKWQMFMTGADNARDAHLKSAGQALNAATNLSDIAINLVSAGAGSALTKGIGSVVINAAQGALGGVADELQENGEDWSSEGMGKRALVGGVTSGVTGAANNKINNSTSKLLDNKLINSGIGRGAISGGLGGATSAGMMTALDGGSVDDIVGNTLEGAGVGALQGGMAGGAQRAGAKAISKAWTAEQNSSFQKAVTKPDKVKGPVYLGKFSQDSFDNISNAYKNAGIDLDSNPDAIDAIKIENNKLYLTPEEAQHLNQRRIQGDGMAPKEVRRTMRNATQNGVVSPNLTGYQKATMGAQDPDKGKALDIAHIGVNEDGSLNLATTYRSHGGKTYRDIKSTLGGSTITPSTDASGSEGLPARTSALQGTNSNIPRQGSSVNSNIPESHRGKQLRLKSAEALLDQYGTIDKPMAKSADALENVQKVADAGFTKPGEVEDIISKVTGSNGKVSKMTRMMVNTAQPVDTITDVSRIIDEQIDLNGLNGLPEGNAAKKYVEAQLNRLESRRNGSITGLDNPEDVFDVVKALEKRSAELRGKSGTNYRTTSAERGDAANFIDNINEILKDRLYSGTDISKVLTPENAAELKSFAPKNQKWADYVDNTIMKSRDIGELRSTMSPFVNMGRIIDNQYMNYATYGSQMSQAAKSNRNLASKLSDLPVVGKVAAPIAELTLNSNAADRARANAYSKAADVADSAASRAADVPGGITQAAPNVDPAGRSTSQNGTLPTGSYDDLGRLQGAYTVDELHNIAAQEAQTEAEVEKLTNSQAMMGGGSADPVFQLPDGRTVNLVETEVAMQNAMVAGDQAAYKELGQIHAALSSAKQNGTSGTVGSLDALRQQSQITNWIEQCQQAFMNAMMAGDVKAAKQYAGMMETVKEVYGLDKEAEEVKISDSDRKTLQNLGNSLNSLDQLETLYNAAGGGKGMSGNFDKLANLLTNGAANYNLSTYNAAKESLGMAIVKNFVNLGATEQDAERYAAMLPEITDTPQMAQQKLATLRGLVQRAQQNVYAQYRLN